MAQAWAPHGPDHRWICSLLQVRSAHFSGVSVLVPLHEWKYHDSKSNFRRKIMQTMHLPCNWTVYFGMQLSFPADPHGPIQTLTVTCCSPPKVLESQKHLSTPASATSALGLSLEGCSKEAPNGSQWGIRGSPGVRKSIRHIIHDLPQAKGGKQQQQQ